MSLNFLYSGATLLGPLSLMIYRNACEKRFRRHYTRDLPLGFREVVVLREWEGLSYKQIADVVDIPMGTVMSRLARARKRLQEALPPAGTKRPQESY